jgi:hypothetical protein
LTGLWKYKVRRFRLIYEVDRKARLIRIFALGHRREVYEELAARLRNDGNRKTTIPLDAQEFIRRFLLHAKPDGVNRVAYGK